MPDLGRVLFIGTATTLIELGGFTLLTDPNFLHRGQRAYLGKGLSSRRLTEPSMAPRDLPRLDAIVLSHLHGDHFDRVARRELSHEPPVFTTPSAARTLRRWKFAADGLWTWEERLLVKGQEELRIRSLPGIHARGPLRTLLPPVMGTLLDYRRPGLEPFRIYLSGDTLLGTHIDDVARRHPDIDVLVLHLGGTRVLWHTVTMDAEQGHEFVRRVRPGAVVPVHHDDYRVFRDPLQRYLDLAERSGQRAQVHPLAQGSSLRLTSTPSR